MIKIKEDTYNDMYSKEDIIIDALGYEGAFNAVSKALDTDTKNDIYDYIIRVYELDTDEEDYEESICKESVTYDRFEVRGYYDSNFRGLADSESFDWYDEAKDYAHELLMSGKDVIIKDTETGNEVKIACGEYNYKFDGDFCINNDIYEFEQSILK